MKCPKCHYENPDDTKFCGRCGFNMLSSKKGQNSSTETLQNAFQELVVGEFFAGRYQVIEELGRGGMGRVY
jgi:ribosomal protein L40E